VHYDSCVPIDLYRVQYTIAIKINVTASKVWKIPRNGIAVELTTMFQLSNFSEKGHGVKMNFRR
jgi:hypothetical protein